MSIQNEPCKTSSHTNIRQRKCPIEFLEIEKDGKKTLSLGYIKDEENILQTVIGTPNRKIIMNIINSAVGALPKSLDTVEKYNLILQSLADSTPRDAHEAKLSAQATVLYIQGMDFLERSRMVLFDDTFARDTWHTILIKTATRLLDLHIKTLEALVRYRQQGEQRIVVQHVTVENGGKAIVGNLMQGGGGSEKK